MVLYLSYMGLLVWCLFLAMGTIGFLSSFAFTYAIFNASKSVSVEGVMSWAVVRRGLCRWGCVLAPNGRLGSGSAWHARSKYRPPHACPSPSVPATAGLSAWGGRQQPAARPWCRAPPASSSVKCDQLHCSPALFQLMVFMLLLLSLLAAVTT